MFSKILSGRRLSITFDSAPVSTTNVSLFLPRLPNVSSLFSWISERRRVIPARVQEHWVVIRPVALFPRDQVEVNKAFLIVNDHFKLFEELQPEQPQDLYSFGVFRMTKVDAIGIDIIISDRAKRKPGLQSGLATAKKHCRSDPSSTLPGPLVKWRGSRGSK